MDHSLFPHGCEVNSTLNQMFGAVIRLLCVVALTACAKAQDYQVISVDHGGTIKGVVKWAGAEPHLAGLPITKDPQICDPQAHKTHDLERLLIGPQGGVANTVVFLKSVQKGKAFDLPPARRFINQRICRYEPHILLVPQHSTLQMTSSDATLHTLNMDGAASYNLPFPFPGVQISRDMNATGLVHLKCNGGHVWMNAEMFVVPHPYYTVTDENGAFQLSGIPEGSYELAAWHEGWQQTGHANNYDVLTQKRVDRPIFSEPKIWEKKVQLQPDATLVVNFSISAQ